VRERTVEDLRGLIIELVAVDESGKDQLSCLQPPEVQKLKGIFSHQKLDLSDAVFKVPAALHMCGSMAVHSPRGGTQPTSLRHKAPLH
jgi:hypothetical protein